MKKRNYEYFQIQNTLASIHEYINLFDFYYSPDLNNDFMFHLLISFAIWYWRNSLSWLFCYISDLSEWEGGRF
jgi:hypothetical protein